MGLPAERDGFGGLVAAMLLAFWPPRVPQYTEKGEPVISWTANPTEGGKRWGKYQLWASYAGPALLFLAFLLQLIVPSAAFSRLRSVTKGGHVENRARRVSEFWF